MLVIQVFSMCVTLFVLQEYVTRGVHAQSHRLLPLTLGLVALNNFYQIVECLSGSTGVFERLEELLIVQMLYLLMQYTLDVLYIRLRRGLQAGLFLSLVVTDIVMFRGYLAQNTDEIIMQDGILAYRVAMYTYSVAILLLATYAYARYTYSRQEQRTKNLLYLALLIPGSALLFGQLTPYGDNEALVPLALVCSCLIVYYLMVTGQLADTGYCLKERLFETSNWAILLFDADRFFLEANQAAKKLLGEELAPYLDRRKKRQSEETVQDKKQTDLMRLLFSHARTHQELVRQDSYYRCEEELVWERGRITGYVLSIIDITEQKKETKLMEKLKRQAEALALSKSRFLARISHDLKSPLHAIIGASDILLAQREIIGRNHFLIKHVKNAGVSLLEQVNSILLFSKLESGRVVLDKKPYSLDSLLEELVSMCMINLQDKPVRLTVSFLTPYPQTIYGDAMRVREMLLNILSNAVKFTAQGEIRCELSCQPAPAKRAGKRPRIKITCKISDTGCGMQKEQLKRIFKEYVSFEEKSQLEGTGLGLTIVRQLAQMMGGQVTGYSDGSSGSSFVIEFYQEADTGTEKDRLCQAHTYHCDAFRYRYREESMEVRPSWQYPKARILVVDDMQVNREILAGLLEPWRCIVDTAADGQAALAAIQEQTYQLILVDMMMPDMSGREAANKLRESIDTPLIMVTAEVSDEYQRYYEQYGFSAYLSKPIDMQQLKQLLEDMLPQELREPVQEGYDQETYHQEVIKAADGINQYTAANIRTLEAFVKEADILIRQMRHMAREEPEQFRIKAHGIKGAARQIGLESLSEQAEIMEMAARTQNQNFLDSHMERYIATLRAAVDKIKGELAGIAYDRPANAPAAALHNDNKSAETITELFNQLKEAFEAYQMQKIEALLAALSTRTLSVGEHTLLEQVQEAYEELDYEKGADLLTHIPGH